jgi:hypothetical protein
MAKTKSDTYTVEYFKSDTDKGVLLKDMVTDNIVTALINMGAEMWATRRRQLVLEQLMAERGGVTPDMIEQYVPTPALLKNWEQERDRFIGNIYDALSRPANTPITAHMPKTFPKVQDN